MSFESCFRSQFEIEQLQIWKGNMTGLFCIPERMADLSCLCWGALQHVQGKSHHKQIHCGNVVSARPPSNNILLDYDFYNALPVLPSYCLTVGTSYAYTFRNCSSKRCNDSLQGNWCLCMLASWLKYLTMTPREWITDRSIPCSDWSPYFFKLDAVQFTG